MTNIVEQVDNLSEFEKAFLCRLLGVVAPEMQVHLGTLPFVDQRVVRMALRSVANRNPEGNSTPDGRKAGTILEKLEISGNVIFTVPLDDGLVLSRSRGTGYHLRLLPLRITKTVHAGIRYQHFGKKWVKPEVTVRCQALMTRVAPGMWKVEVSSTIAKGARNELLELYGTYTNVNAFRRVKK